MVGTTDKANRGSGYASTGSRRRGLSYSATSRPRELTHSRFAVESARARCESLDVLDLTDPVVRHRLELDEADLTGDDYTICQQVAVLVRQAGFDAILVPSAALPGYQTLVVFHRALGKVRSPGNDRVRQAPPRMVDLLETIRLHHDVPTSVRRLLWIIRGAGRQAVIRARRS